MKFFVAALFLAVMAGVAWFQGRRWVGDWNRALTGLFLGPRVKESRFFAQNERGEFIAWKYIAAALLVAAVFMVWLGILSVATS